MDEDDYRIDGELHDMEVERLERRIRELEQENADFRVRLGLPPRVVEEPEKRQVNGKVVLDLVNGTMTITSL